MPAPKARFFGAEQLSSSRSRRRKAREFGADQYRLMRFYVLAVATYVNSARAENSYVIFGTAFA
jgi:hypothetical protein